MQGEGQHANHHPFIRFGRVSGDGERVVRVVVPIEVCDVERELEYLCIESHPRILNELRMPRYLRRSFEHGATQAIAP